MQTKFIQLLLLCSIPVFMISCQKDLSDSFVNTNSSVNSLEAFANKIGVHPNSVKEFEDFFLVSNDIAFSKADLLKTKTRQVVVGQSAYTNITAPISRENQRDISIYIDVVATYLPQSNISKFTEAIRAAINNFNTLIPGSYIRMREVFSSTSADIQIHLVDGLPISTPADGVTLYPVNGKPGSDMWLDLSKADNYYYPTVASATCLTTHELGHAIGLFHTNEIPNPSLAGDYLKVIPGTPGFASYQQSDPDLFSFIITPGFAITEWTQTTDEPEGGGFSDYDKIAIQYLYPPAYAKLRTVYTSMNSSDYEQREFYDVYIDFFADLQCTIPEITHAPEPITTRVWEYHNSYNASTNYHNFTVPANVSSYKLYSNRESYNIFGSGFETIDFFYSMYYIYNHNSGLIGVF